MKTYVMTTGIVFGLLTLVHVWRFIEEGASVFKDSWLVAITLVSAGLSLWALRLLRTPRRAGWAGVRATPSDPRP